MVKIHVEDDLNLMRSPDDEVTVQEEVLVDDTIKVIFNANPDLLHDKNVLIVNHPMCNLKLLNEDYEVIEPGIIENIIGEIHNKLCENNYSFVLINNIESYVLRNSDSSVMSSYLTKLTDIIKILDDYHVEIFITLSEEFYKNNYTIFDIYLD